MGSKLSEGFYCKADWRYKDWNTKTDRGAQQFLAAHPECKLWDEQFQDLGVSGRGDNRRKGALARIIDQAEKGIFPPKTILLVESVSRLTRDTQKEGLRLLIKLFDLGFSIAFSEWGNKILGIATQGVKRGKTYNIFETNELMEMEKVVKRFRY